MTTAEAIRFRLAGARNRLALWIGFALFTIYLAPTAHSASADEFPPPLIAAVPDALLQDPDQTEKDAKAFEPDEDRQQASGAQGDLKVLLRRIEKLEQERQKPGAKEGEKKEEDWFDLSTEKWNVRMGGHIQMEYIAFPTASPSIPNDINYFEFRRLRLLAEGTGYGVYDFRLQMTLEPEAVGTSPPGIVTSP